MTPITPSHPTASARGGHPGRILVIASHTFTQLVRMKVFYFLAVFAAIIIASNAFELPQHATPETMGVNVLRAIKSWSLGAMTLFSVVISVVATALLIPRDVEDRTLYTILAKPVPRLDYLAGKLCGVILLLASSLLIMDLLMTLVLQLRTSMVVAEQIQAAKSMGWDHQAIESLRRDTLVHGPDASLQCAVLAVFFRAVIMAALALFISTFSTSTLFTTTITFLLYFIGHFQADARDWYLHANQPGEGWVARAIAALLALILPDLQLFHVIDAVIEGQTIPLWTLGKLCLVGIYYALFFTLASWWVFSDKEF